MLMDDEVVELKNNMAQVSREVEQLRNLFTTVNHRLVMISRSLKFCQSRCHVDNPRGRWRNLWDAVKKLFTGTSDQPMQITANGDER